MLGFRSRRFLFERGATICETPACDRGCCLFLRALSIARWLLGTGCLPSYRGSGNVAALGMSRLWECRGSGRDFGKACLRVTAIWPVTMGRLMVPSLVRFRAWNSIQTHVVQSPGRPSSRSSEVFFLRSVANCSTASSMLGCKSKRRSKCTN